MTAPTPLTIREQQLWLSTNRGIFWENESSLILADLHFGKTGHFRKNGINVPAAVYKEDLQRMVELISFFQPKKIIAVGDLFHSKENLELSLFSKTRGDFSKIEFILVKGNHDSLADNWYERNEIKLAQDNLSIGAFNFVHDPANISIDSTLFSFSGHIHPGISISGLAKQNLSFPCFYFSEHNAILPAFSKFSGTAKMKKKKDNRIFAIVNHSLIEIEK